MEQLFHRVLLQGVSIIMLSCPFDYVGRLYPRPHCSSAALSWAVVLRDARQVSGDRQMELGDRAPGLDNSAPQLSSGRALDTTPAASAAFLLLTCCQRQWDKW